MVVRATPIKRQDLRTFFSEVCDFIRLRGNYVCQRGQTTGVEKIKTEKVTKKKIGRVFRIFLTVVTAPLK